MYPLPSRINARALLLACHPAPAAVVTALAGLLAWSQGLPIARALAVVLAIGAGQLSIGWSNDWLDASRDQAVGRADKPIAAGLIRANQVGNAALVALPVTAAASAMLGWRAAVVQLIGVGSGWAYNAGLKGTGWSWAPYALTFGLLPAVVTLADPAVAWPAWWALAAGALLGIGAHFVNVLPDLAQDAATGVRGLPHRLGATTSAVLAPGLLWLASVVAIAGPPGSVSRGGWGALAVAAGLGILAVWGARGRGHRILPLLVTAAIAALDIVVLVQRSGFNG